ncbi:MAG: PD-(D/E)XK nuclease family protein [Bacteroidales bacterium]|nr:PD-(D/E)XK nuclease family protein [Bacteroidales bacterium]
MNPFLRQVALHYYRQEGLGEKIFIFPNRRSLAFFRKHLCDCAAEDKRTLLAPRLTTINDFFCTMTGTSSSDRISLLLELYPVYGKLNPKAESLDDFIYWGDVLLSDFDDVDKYRVDARMLFANIADLKAIRDDFEYADKTQLAAIEKLAGHFKTVPHTGNPRRDVKENFLQIWNILFPLYTGFREALKARGMAYEGMVYRDLADRLEDTPVQDVLNSAFPGIRTCVFVGLNALNECEKAVMKKLHNAGLAEFCWDYDGKFIRENMALFPSAFTPEIPAAKPRVHICSVPSATGQAKLLPGLLASVPEGERGLDFAVVLADETMLMPVLNSLPGLESGVNVTMGYPMGASEWSSLMHDVLALQTHMRQKGGEWFFYHRNVHDIVSSAIVQALLSEEEKDKVKEIVKAAKYYIPQSDFGGGSVLGTIFRPVVKDLADAGAAQTDALADYLLEVTVTLASLLCGAPQADVLQLDFAKRYYQAVTRLRDLSLGVLPRTWIHLLEQILAGISVPFEGEPLGGLQVMGPLETRALDFKHIVILNANEGVFPRISAGSSFVPAELRIAFGLPTYERQDAVWEYYFYRMIARAENVWMLYDSRTEGLKTGEESRYAKQLRYLYPDRFDIEESVAQTDVSGSDGIEDIPKTQADIDCIRNKEYSASSLSKYITCPAQFYYAVVQKLEPEDEIKDTLDPGTLGSVCHDTLEALYEGEEAMKSDRDFDKLDRKKKGFQRTVTKEYLQGWLKRSADIKRKVLSLIRLKLKSVEVAGEDLVTADIIVRYVLRVIESDLKLLGQRDSFRILGLEEHMDAVEIAGHKFFGYIDRIDSFDEGIVRVVDYKTGGDKPEVLSADYNAAKLLDHKYKAALQFFIYDRLIEADKRFAGKEVRNAMYAMGSFFTEDVQAYPQNEDFNRKVEDALEALFAEMEDPAHGFARVEDKIGSPCGYCDFRAICGRASKER